MLRHVLVAITMQAADDCILRNMLVLISADHMCMPWVLMQPLMQMLL